MVEKEKLEEELEFLKESLDSDIINKDEYEREKARIESKLKEIDAIEIKKDASDIKIEEKTEEEKPITEDDVKIGESKEKPVEDEIEIQEITEPSRIKKPIVEEKKEEPIKIKEEPLNEEKPEIKAENIEEKKEEPKTVIIDEKEEDASEILNHKTEVRSHGEKKKSYTVWGIAAIILLIVIVYFSFFLFAPAEHPIEGSHGEEVFEPLCFSDTDCTEEGKVGICNNPGKEDAECEFVEDVEVEYTILNSDDCFNCDTSRVEKIIRSWFPNAKKNEADVNTPEGRELALNLNIELLPAFIFEKELEDTINFKERKIIFSKVDDKFILSSGASGSSFYLSKNEFPNTLDIFLMKDDVSSEKAEANIQEFLDIFQDKIIYNKHIVDRNDALIKSLKINTFPTFLVNNVNRFGGIQPAETIKNNFCQLNDLAECEYKLTESLV